MRELEEKLSELHNGEEKHENEPEVTFKDSFFKLDKNVDLNLEMIDFLALYIYYDGLVILPVMFFMGYFYGIFLFIMLSHLESHLHILLSLLQSEW